MDANVNAVIYARFSSHSQQEQSIDGQLRYCRDYAAQHGYTIIEEYIDRAITGTSDQRPDFQRMIRDAAGRGFSFILVWKLDRFSRNRYDSAIYKRQLSKYGVRVLSVTEGVGAGDEGMLLEAILEAMAETYSRQLAQNVKRGMQESARKCLTCGGPPILGYKVNADKRYELEPNGAAIVQRIFGMYANGSGKQEIADALNGDGCRNVQGKPFTINNITKTLANVRYTGLYKFGDVEVPGGMPQIIAPDLWDACQARTQAKPPRIRQRANYLLLGKVFCGHCGGALVGLSGRGKSGTAHRYYGHSAGARAICKKHAEKKGWLEYYVTEQACKYVLNPDNTEFIAQRVCAAWAAENSGDYEAIDARIKSIGREINKMADAFVDAGPVLRIHLNAQIEELNTEKLQLIGRRTKLQARRPLDVEEVKRYLTQLCLGDPHDEAVQKQVIDTFINCVYVWDDKIVVYFNVRDGGQIEFAKAKEHAAGVRINSTTAHQFADSANMLYIFVGGYIGLVCFR